jgi:hypothetical protein
MLNEIVRVLVSIRNSNLLLRINLVGHVAENEKLKLAL